MARKDSHRAAGRPGRRFIALWSLAVFAAVSAFVVHLALRGRTMDVGYRLGVARSEQARLREMKRVLGLEAASYQSPQRVEHIARTLLHMVPPPPERVINVRLPKPTKADSDAVAKAADGAQGAAP